MNSLPYHRQNTKGSSFVWNGDVNPSHLQEMPEKGQELSPTPYPRMTSKMLKVHRYFDEDGSGTLSTYSSLEPGLGIEAAGLSSLPSSY